MSENNRRIIWENRGLVRNHQSPEHENRHLTVNPASRTKQVIQNVYFRFFAD